MAARRILKFPQTDDPSSHVLVQVSPKGSKPLDLKLVGTEGRAAYVCSLRHDRVAPLRVGNCPVSETEWQAILQSILDQQPLPGIQASAAVQTGSSISLSRLEPGGEPDPSRLQQRLGAVTLNHDQAERIELFEWCATSVDAAGRAEESAAAAGSRIRDLQASVDRLEMQLDELVAAKQEDDVVLLQKFRDLLNEKKVKIREQQKIITELTADGARREDDAEAEADAGEVQTLKKGKRAPKRKAQAVENESPEADVDMAAGDTTEATDSVASDHGDDDEGEDENMGEAAGEPAPPQKKQNAPPPPRALPFQKKKRSVAADDSDDDEL
ncbi:DNA double-strand break repair and VJ recombination XRCC4 [Metarhizium album ARSEF 1941]|uniref:DNA double-strand break repair and VJ recombination XRCC4 n=1 Tax=Metarhizium album (strain ARSEF 1941) TaxID=1081103 RepID=A0A0B2X9G8_METAS|nr:DNA double-strand break repair and VJ recombination XRCC4 [Metarhizium album ARSEF 1941]KHO01961.1 DNA double-strand break repair and VJ recombination XRCC4 [Metarhizium album ARSEF 1941]